MKTKYSTKENERQKYKQNILNEKKQQLRSLLNLKMAVSGLSWGSSDVKQGQLSLNL